MKQYPQKNPPRTSPESILVQWNFSDMGTTQMGMAILALYSRQVPRNSISIHFRRRGLRGKNDLIQSAFFLKQKNLNTGLNIDGLVVFKQMSLCFRTGPVKRG